MAFTKADAEAAGWAFVHSVEAEVRDLEDGVSKVIPAFYRAEKYVNEKLVSQAGHSLQHLLDTIEEYENHLERRFPTHTEWSPSDGDLAPGRPPEEAPAEEPEAPAEEEPAEPAEPEAPAPDEPAEPAADAAPEGEEH
jgi:hypothetical protein